MLNIAILTSVFDFGKTLIDKLIPDPQAKAEAQLKLVALQQEGAFKAIDAELEAMKVSMSAINTEGASADRWTSRARPAFLYVIYIVILFGLPLAVLSIWWPGQAGQVQTAFAAWVGGIPDSLMTLFGTGYLGYAATRSYDKHLDAKVKIKALE